MAALCLDAAELDMASFSAGGSWQQDLSAFETKEVSQKRIRLNFGAMRMD
jgi:hypothetical protein